MDVYVQPTGVGIVGATPRGTVSFLGQVAPKTFATGDYEITLTAAGDPSNVVFASSAVNLAAGVTNVFVIADEGGLGTAAISVIVAQDNAFVLYSANATVRTARDQLCRRRRGPRFRNQPRILATHLAGDAVRHGHELRERARQREPADHA